MIQYVKRKNLNVTKYDACIENSIQSRIYAYSWYLDIVANNWDVLVLNDYEAVMPIPWRKKYFIKYVYTPLRVLELGVFSVSRTNLDDFLSILFKKFLFLNLRMNTQNVFSDLYKNHTKVQQQHFIFLKDDYNTISNNYRRDRKRDLTKAIKLDLIEKWNDSTDNLINLFRNNVGKRFKTMSSRDYKIMKQIVDKCIEKKTGQILSIYDNNNKLISSGFFIRNNKEITILFSSTDFNNRKNGANTLLIDRAIFKYQQNNKAFYFGGSSISSIAKYFKSFGAIETNYSLFGYNNLPFILKIFKK